jgi:hypothetical protein
LFDLDENGCDERSGYCENGEDIPRAPAEAVPRKTNDANDKVGNEDDGQDDEDVV